MGIGRPEKSTPLTRLLALGAWLGAATATAGCRTTESDVQRWTTTAQGPNRLVAVVIHDKYERDLRLEAALALVTMPPREGQRVGIGMLVEALQSLPQNERQTAVASLVPKLLEGISLAPETKDGQRMDPSVPYKDAAYALLTANGGSLVTDPESSAAVKRALAEWASADFEARLDDQTQAFGVEQMMRTLGADGVRRLPELITPESEKIDRIVALVAELGDTATKNVASKRLATRGRFVASAKWRKAQRSIVHEQNAKAKLKPTKEQFEKQLAQYQNEQVMRLYSLMNRLGGKPVVDFLLEQASQKDLEEKRRATALAALKGHIDKQDRTQITRLLDLAAADETPDKVRDVALQRVGELPRALVVERLYGLFDSDNWKVRWVAAENVLRMSDQSHLDEFMKRLGKVDHMAITEPLRYGNLIGRLKGKQSPRALAEKYSKKRNSASVRASALGFYFDNGRPGELGMLEEYRKDREKVPGCARDAEDCEWKCTFQGELREVETIGEFVEYCVIPAIEARKQAPSAKKRSNKK